MTLLIYGWLIMKFKACTMREIIGPQFQVALQPAIILVCVFLGDLAGKITVLSKRRSGRKDLIKLAGMTAVFVFGLIYSVFSEKVFYGELSNWLVDQRYKANIIPAYSNMIPFYRAGLVPLNIDRASGIMVSPQQAEEIEGVTGYILSVTTPGEPIFTFPELGIYNFFTDRPCVSRFNIPTCIWATPKWGQEIINDLKTRQPRYIIYGNRLSNITKSLGDKKELLPEVGAYINGNYVKVASFGKIDVLKRK
jgi:hypothetical protein